MAGKRTSDASDRTALVLSGGGARGAYEAGVLSYVYDSIVPAAGAPFEFDIVAGTSVGAIHAGFIGATAHLAAAERSKRLRQIWTTMALDLVGVPLRALGVETLVRSERAAGGKDIVGGLVDLTPLEQLVEKRIPWKKLRENLAGGRPGLISVSCTDIATGRVVVFLDGAMAEAAAWSHDPTTVAVQAEIDSRHVRASAAIPFLFPAVRIGDDWYLDGGLRLNTPLAPALRSGATRLLVVALRHERSPAAPGITLAEEAISQPAFLLGKVLNILMLDQLEHELRRLDMINTLIEGASATFGSGCLDRINEATRARRGIEYHTVQTAVVRPSVDLGELAAHAYHHRHKSSRSRGVLAFLLARTALLGVPENEADLLSYIYFDASFTRELFELGREDAQRQETAIAQALWS